MIIFKAAPTQGNASEEQLEAGNYKKRHIRAQGLEISIENPKGSVRSGKGPGGKKWRTNMVHDYGYIKGSLGVDGDHVDCYVGPNKDADTVYIVHQRKAGDWKRFDEDKCMIGFSSEAEAKIAYLKHYNDPRFLGPVTAMPVNEFKQKVMQSRENPKMIKGILVFKSHIRGYTKKDGTYVAPHEDKRSRSEKELGVKKPKITDSPEFKRWFGESKVVDGNGDPLVVYHGTTEGDIDEFDVQKITDGNEYISGFYFSSDPKEASKYAEKKYDASPWGQKKTFSDSSAVYPVYLSIQKPLPIDKYLPFFNEDGSLTRDAKNIIDWAEELTTYGYEYTADDLFDVIGNWTEKDGSEAKGLTVEDLHSTLREKFPDTEDVGIWLEYYMKHGKYDGMIIGDEYVVANPGQIKSAVGNNGAFDKEDSRITKSQPIALFSKAYVRAHTRKLASGKEIKVGSYHNKVQPRGPKPKKATADTMTMDLFPDAPSLERRDEALEMAIDHLEEDAKQSDLPKDEQREDKELVETLKEAKEDKGKLTDSNSYNKLKDEGKESSDRASDSRGNEISEGDKPMNDTQEVKTLSLKGKEITVKRDGGSVSVVVGGEEIPVKSLMITMTRVQGLGNIQALNTDKGLVSLKDAAEVQPILDAALKAKEDIHWGKIHRNIPGARELKRAQEALAAGLDKDEERMRRIMRDSFSSSKPVGVGELQNKVDELKRQYPKAAAWMKWSTMSPATDMGFRARQAAKALEEGQSLEEAKKIAELSE